MQFCSLHNNVSFVTKSFCISDIIIFSSDHNTIATSLQVVYEPNL